MTSFADRRRALDGSFVVVGDDEMDAALAARLEQAWGVKLLPLAKYARIDRAVADRSGRLVGACEFKRRTILSTDYPTLYVAADKVAALLQFAAICGGSFALFIAELWDAVLWIPAEQAAQYPIEWRGSHATPNRPPSQGSMHVVPISAFQRLP